MFYPVRAEQPTEANDREREREGSDEKLALERDKLIMRAYVPQFAHASDARLERFEYRRDECSRALTLARKRRDIDQTRNFPSPPCAIAVGGSDTVISTLRLLYIDRIAHERIRG